MGMKWDGKKYVSDGSGKVSKSAAKPALPAGHKQRPRGRAPAGKKWDAKKGWVAE